MAGYRVLLSAGSILAGLPQLAMAAEGVPGTDVGAEAGSIGASSTSGSVVEEIIVTAQRRDQRLQDVPLSVTALSSEGLERQAVTSTADLTVAVPGLVMTRASSVWQPFMRGVGSQTIQPGSDPSIATYVDGIYLSAPGALLFSFNNIERIEALKGPQGTLFGRNATGGLIQIVTRDPSAETEAKASIGYANYDTISMNGYLSGGNEQIAGSVSLLYTKQHDGWGVNNYVLPAGQTHQPGYRREVGVLRDFGIHSKLVVTPSDRATAKINFFYMNTRTDQNQYRNPFVGTTVAAVGGSPPFAYTGGFYDTNTDINFDTRSRQYIFSVEGAYEADFATVKSISSYLRARVRFDVPADSTPQIARFSTLPSLYRYDTFTQELQLLSNDESGPEWLQWIAGLYYLNSRGAQVRNLGQNENDLDSVSFGEQQTNSYSAYGQATFDLSERTHLTVGLRYTSDRLGVEQHTRGLNPRPAAVGTSAELGRISYLVDDLAVTQSKMTWKAVIDHELAEDVMAYASYSRGYKSGAWNHVSLCPAAPVVPTCQTVQPPAEPEVLDAYEIGLKSMFLDRRLRLNLSGYYYDYKDIQVSAVVGTPPTVVINNAASSRIFGFDLDGEARITDSFILNFNGAYVDAKFKDYPGAVYFFPRAVAPFNAAQSIENAGGNAMTRAPKLSGNVGFSYTIPAGEGEVALSGNVYYSSKYWWDVQNRTKQPAYALVNGQIAYSPNDTWRVRLWAKNLTGKKHFASISSIAFGDFYAPAAPRTYGIGIDWTM